MEHLVFCMRRIRLSQEAQQLLSIAMRCFVVTSLLFASASWVRLPVFFALTTVIFVEGVSVI